MSALSAAAQDRDNNFNLLRMAAALAVLVSHAWPISRGPGTAEPLERLTVASLGTLAVYVFFALSGFFVSASWARRASLADFLAARALRLFPALAVSLAAVLLVLGPLTTSLPLADYFAHPATARFLPRNLALLTPQYTLPGVFAANPYPAVEGSIWTLAYEAECYLALLALGLAGLSRRGLGLAFAGYGLLWLATAGLALPVRLAEARALSLPFAIGMAAYHGRDRLRLTLPRVATLALVAVLARGTPLAQPALVLALAAAGFWAGLLASPRLRAYNRFGDYSYGVYLYAFPVQGLVASAAGGSLSPFANIALSVPATLALAVLSWHLVERPALALRRARRAALSPPVAARR